MAKHHLANGRFRNNQTLKNTHSSLLKAIKWQLNRPKLETISQPIAEPSDKLTQVETQGQLVWIGHATFLLQYQGLAILTDPVFSKRASPVQFAGPKRTTPAALSIAQLPHIDVVVVSHDHYDHLDKHSVLELWQQQVDKPPLFVVPLKVGKWLDKLGIDNWIELDWWQSAEALGWTFTAVPVQHFSGRGLVQNNTLWAGWVLRSPAPECKQVFFAGDTGYSPDFKAIGERFSQMDLSLLPIGAYEPRWFMREVHVNPEEAVKIHLDVNSRLSVGMHWGSFVLTDEQMDAPVQELEIAKSNYDIADDAFITLVHGEIFSLADKW